MKKYSCQSIDIDHPEFISIVDELPLWSAPFGLKLLDIVVMRKNICVLDIGCGTGFPLIEIAQRLGESSRIYGIDAWEAVLKRVRLKIEVNAIHNVEVVHGLAEHMPFENNLFDLIVSNNGINNVQDIQQTLKECYRVSKSDTQMVITYNLDNSMIEFYTVFQKILEEHMLPDAIQRMKEHIYHKRKPLNEMKGYLENSGFHVKNVIRDSFNLRFLDGTTLFNHRLIRNWFLDSWRMIVAEHDVNAFFGIMECRLNEIARQTGEISFSIPFVTIDSRR